MSSTGEPQGGNDAGLSEEDKKLAIRLAQIIEGANEK